MTWLAWRQYRVALLCAVVVITLYALVVVVLGTGSYSGTLFALRSMVLGSSSLWSLWVGLAVATFIGAPLIAREREQGTHHFAWTQGIGRTHWLVVKFGLLLLGLIVLSIGFALIANKRFEFEGQNTIAGYSMITVLGVRVGASWRGFFSTSTVAVMLVVFALALGVAVGCFVRRNVPAMTTAFALFLVAYLALTNWYIYLIPPQTYILNHPRGYSQDVLGNAVVMKWAFIDQQGKEVKGVVVTCQYSSQSSKETDVCTPDLREKITYQPQENYWPLQWIVSGILFVLSLGLGVLIFLRVRSSVD